MRRVPAWWWTGLTAALACGYLYIGAMSPLPAIRWAALAGGLLALAALWSASRSRVIALLALVVGALAPVVTGWWSLVVPLTAVLIILCGTVAIRSVPRGSRHRDAPAPAGRV